MKEGQKFAIVYQQNGRTYSTPKAAASAWAQGVYQRMFMRQQRKTGVRPDLDAGWVKRNFYTEKQTEKRKVYSGNDLFEFEVYSGQPQAVQKAKRRALKIFERTLK